MSSFALLFAGLAAGGEDGRFRVTAIPGAPSYLAARSSAGNPALLVRSGSLEPLMPVRLAGIEARYDVRCLLRDESGTHEEHLSIVECLARGAEEVRFFCGCADQLMALLGPEPATTALGEAVDRLVAMFRALSLPARKDVVGLIGELCMIYSAADAGRAVRAWRVEPQERFDFVAGSLRLDVKAASGAERVHHLSALQASPAQGTTGVIASLLVSIAAGGESVRHLVDAIVSRLGTDEAAIFRLREGITLTMGVSTPEALQAGFDMKSTMQSLRCFNMASVPALRPPFPDGVSDVRFRTDLDSVEPASLRSLRRMIDRQGQAVLPARLSSTRTHT